MHRRIIDAAQALVEVTLVAGGRRKQAVDVQKRPDKRTTLLAAQPMSALDHIVRREDGGLSVEDNSN